MAVEIVDRGLRLTRVTAIPAQELPHMRPILLLGVRVVVLLVGAPAGEGDLPPAAVLQQERVDEFRAVVRVEPAQREGQGRPELLEGRAHRALGLAPQRAGLYPARQDVRKIQRLENLAVGPIAGTGDQVDLGEAGVVRSQWSVRMGM